MERILEILEIEFIIKDELSVFVKEDFNEEIFIENIFFKYEKEWVLKDFLLKVFKGYIIVFVG